LFVSNLTRTTGVSQSRLNGGVLAMLLRVTGGMLYGANRRMKLKAGNAFVYHLSR
jgi:hypothetical protein